MDKDEIQIVPDLLDELLRTLDINESTPEDVLQSIRDLQAEISAQAAVHGSEHPSLLSLLRELAEKYISIHHFDHAERLLRRLERAYRRTYGPKHIEYIYQSIRLAEMLQLQGRHDDAKEMYFRGLQLFSDYYDVVSVEDELVGREFVSPVVASQRFLRAQQQRVGTKGHREDRRSPGNATECVAESEPKDSARSSSEENCKIDSKSRADSKSLNDSQAKPADSSRDGSTDCKGFVTNEDKSIQSKECDSKDDEDKSDTDTDMDTDTDTDSDTESSSEETTSHSRFTQDDDVSVSSATSPFALPGGIDERFVTLERIYRGLARTHQELRNYAFSERYYKGLLTLYYDTFFPRNPFHRIILETIHGLSIVLEAQENFAEAEDICRQSLIDCELYYGPNHSLTLTAMSTLARLLHALKKSAESEEFYMTAIERSIISNGWKHQLTLSLRTRLSILYKELGRYRESLEIVEKVLLPFAKEVFGPYDLQTLQIYDTIGELYCKLRGADSLPMSKSFYEQAYEGKVKYFHTENHPEVYSSLFLLGKVCHMMCSWKHRNDYEEILRTAHTTLSKCYKGLTSFYASLSHNPMCIEITMHFGQFLLQFNRFDEAQPVYQRLLAFYEERYSIAAMTKSRDEYKRGSAEFAQSNTRSASRSLFSPSRSYDQGLAFSPNASAMPSHSWDSEVPTSSSVMLRTYSRQATPHQHLLSSMDGLNASANESFVISPMDFTPGYIERTLSRGGTRNERATSSPAKSRPNSMGVRQGIALNARHQVLAPSSQLGTFSNSSRQHSPFRTTTLSASLSASYDHDRSFGALSPAAFGTNHYGQHPAASLEIHPKTVREALEKLTIPELLVYADTNYQLALIAERKSNYVDGLSFFYSAFVIFTLLLQSPHYSLSSTSSEKEVTTQSKSERSPKHSLESVSHREIANNLFLTMMDSGATNNKNSGMLTIPNIEEYPRERIEELRADALEQIHHAEYLSKL